MTTALLITGLTLIGCSLYILGELLAAADWARAAEEYNISHMDAFRSCELWNAMGCARMRDDAERNLARLGGPPTTLQWVMAWGAFALGLLCIVLAMVTL